MFRSPSGGCVDLVNPQTQVSDCPLQKALCNDPVYLDVMKEQCPKTCGLCGNNGIL
ncbi:shTK domain protein [Ostertagia ostertagi]